MLAPDCLPLSVALLSFYLDSHWFRLCAENHGPAFEQGLVDVRRPFQGKVARPQGTGAIEPEDISWQDAGHLEREADRVADRDQVGPPVYVDGDVVARLGGQIWQQGLNVAVLSRRTSRGAYSRLDGGSGGARKDTWR